MRKCREWISLHSLVFHFLILFPFPHFLSISSSFSYSLSIFSQPGCHNLCNPEHIIAQVTLVKLNLTLGSFVPLAMFYYRAIFWLVRSPQVISLVAVKSLKKTKFSKLSKFIEQSIFNSNNFLKYSFSD